MDLGTAIRFAQLVDAAYAVPPDNLGNRAGEIVKARAAGTRRLPKLRLNAEHTPKAPRTP